MQKFYVKNI